MLRNNVSIDDCLVNGLLSTIFDTKQNSSGILSKNYFKFQGENEGLTKMISNRCASENNIVLIIRVKQFFQFLFNFNFFKIQNQLFIEFSFLWC